jgi:hypothetical protein
MYRAGHLAARQLRVTARGPGLMIAHLALSPVVAVVMVRLLKLNSVDIS